eukprot:gene6496-14429_t
MAQCKKLCGSPDAVQDRRGTAEVAGGGYCVHGSPANACKPCSTEAECGHQSGGPPYYCQWGEDPSCGSSTPAPPGPTPPGPTPVVPGGCPAGNNSNTSGYNPNAARDWADDRCKGGAGECACPGGIGTSCPNCQCAEFTAHALCHGGMFKDCGWSSCASGCAAPHTTCSSGSRYVCHGQNLKWGPTLATYLRGQGWHDVTGQAPNVPAGSAVFYNERGSSYAHTCFARGDGTVDCHNNQ